MNHVSVSPTDGNGPTQGHRKTLTRVGIEPTTFGLDLPTEQAVGTEDVNVNEHVQVQGKVTFIQTLAV